MSLVGVGKVRKLSLRGIEERLCSVLLVQLRFVDDVAEISLHWLICNYE